MVLNISTSLSLSLKTEFNIIGYTKALLTPSWIPCHLGWKLFVLKRTTFPVRKNELKSVCIALKEIDIVSTSWLTRGDINNRLLYGCMSSSIKRKTEQRLVTNHHPLCYFCLLTWPLYFIATANIENNTLYNIWQLL